MVRPSKPARIVTTNSWNDADGKTVLTDKREVESVRTMTFVGSISELRSMQATAKSFSATPGKEHSQRIVETMNVAINQVRDTSRPAQETKMEKHGAKRPIGLITTVR